MSEVEEIKAKIDLVDFIGKYVPLKKAGTNYKGLCPFHVEKSPSFMVSPDKQIWHCFGCSRGGDVLKFVMEKEGLSFPEALQLLADMTGTTLSKVATGGIDKRKNLLAINELAAKYFEKVLEASAEGRKAQYYLVDRGLKIETIKEFRIGCAPSSGRAVLEFLQKRGIGTPEMEAAGLVVMKGRYPKDKFFGRVMFPICDSQGRVVAFTGRVIDDKGIPKYLNSPETPIFKKGEILYGLHLAKEHIQKTGYSVLVEGQMDVISSHQAGVKNVVAASGTATTEAQIQMLRRYADKLVLALDADNAGVEATKRIFEIASRFDMEIKVALLGDAKDPDSLIKAGGNWQEVLDKAVPMMEYYFSVAIEKFDTKELDGRKALTKELLAVISEVNDPVEKDHYLKKLSSLVGVEVRALYDAVSKPLIKKPFAGDKKEDKGGDKVSPGWLEERIMALGLFRPELMELILPKAKTLKWASGLANTIYEAVVSCYTSPDLFDLDQVISKLPDYEKTAVLELLLVVEESYQEATINELAHEVQLYLGMLLARSVASKRQELVLAIAEAEKANDKDRLNQLMNQLSELS
ncbi:MAG: DNA primase [Patescibacteria group bacterium]